MNRQHIKRFNGITFLLLIFITGAFSVTKITIPDSDLSRFLRGETFRTVENHYQETFPHKNLAIGLWAAVQYTLFKEGRSGVVVGKDHWLFSIEEFQLPPAYRENWENNLNRIIETERILTGRKKQLIVALVPEKADIHRGRLDRQTPHNNLHLYEQSLHKLNEAGVMTIDLKEVLLQHQLDGKQPFLRTDTHWTPGGAGAAAEKISKSALIEPGETSFLVYEDTGTEHPGDLTSFIPTGKVFSLFGPAPDLLKQVSFVKQASADALFGDVTLTTALIGTSYSADSRWNFHGWLQYYLHREIVNYAEKGHGPFPPMQRFLESGPEQTADIETIIWEIPVRYLLINKAKEDQ